MVESWIRAWDSIFVYIKSWLVFWSNNRELSLKVDTMRVFGLCF